MNKKVLLSFAKTLSDEDSSCNVKYIYNVRSREGGGGGVEKDSRTRSIESILMSFNDGRKEKAQGLKVEEYHPLV